MIHNFVNYNDGHKVQIEIENLTKRTHQLATRAAVSACRIGVVLRSRALENTSAGTARPETASC